MQPYEEQLSESFAHLLKEADLYFMETGKLHSTLAELTRKLEQAGISYAVLGAIALAQYGYRRMTATIDILLSPDVTDTIRELHLPEDFAGRLDPSVQPAYCDLWRRAQTSDPRDTHSAD